MKLHILSDLHLEHDGNFTPPDVNADVVLLPGDTDVGIAGVTWALASFDSIPVIYVCGNHEYYNHNIRELNHELKEITADTNVTVLENETVQIGDVIFAGCALWTDFNLFGNQSGAMANVGHRLNDFRLIRSFKERPFSTEEALALHMESKLWIEEIATEARTQNQKLVILTHHAPARKSIADRFASNILSAGFVSDLDDFVADSGAVLWAHGHVHDCFDYQLQTTRVVCNPRGYPKEAGNGFRPDLVIEI